MKIYKYILYTIMLFLFTMPNVYAECTEAEKKEFKKVEDQYTAKYEFDKATKTYTIYFNTPNPDKYRYQIYSEKKIECTKNDENVSKCINFPPDEYDVEIIGTTNTCNDVLKAISLKLPEYNKYSEDPLCKGIEEFVLCSPTYNKEIDYDTFISRVETYKKTKAKKEALIEEKDDDEKDSLDKVTNYIKDNLIQIIIIVVFIILLIITTVITVKSIRKSRRLE